MQSATSLQNLDNRRQAIASVAPFTGWPEAALLRLARSSQVSRHAVGAALAVAGPAAGSLTLVVRGAVQASITDAGGRRITFKVGSGPGVYGMLPMLDGREMPSDLIAIEPVVALAIPYAAVRAELALAPELWESIALEAGARARTYTRQMKRFLFDSPRLRMAALLASLAQEHARDDAGAVVIGLRIPQARLAELLGISRQWTTELVREMTRARLIEWRYGRVTIIDLDGLRAIASEGINLQL
jgi:CRP/FNR family cyclic AMP-dependent transcriptional regulator